MSDSLEMVLDYWLMVLAVFVGPSLASAAMSLRHRLIQRQLDAGSTALNEPAHVWAHQTTRRTGLSTTLERGPFDGYVPALDQINLRPAVWDGHLPGHLAIAAHEIGHALNARRVGAEWLPAARLASAHLWHAVVAALVVGALLGAPWVFGLAGALVVLSVAVGAVVLADEAQASLNGLELLEAHLDEGARRRVATSMGSAFSVYAAGVLVQLGTLVLMPTLASTVSTQAVFPTLPTLPFVPSTLAALMLLGLTPLLVVRALVVAIQILRPEQVDNEYLLMSILHAEQRQEVLTGVAALLLVAFLHDAGTGWVFGVTVVMAMAAAIGPVSNLLLGLVLFPFLMVLQVVRRLRLIRLPRSPVPDHGSRVLMALYSNPPWYLRASWMVRVAYLPMVFVCAVQMFG